MDGKTTTQETRRLLETQLANYAQALERCGEGDRWYFQKRVEELRERLEALNKSQEAPA